MSRPRGWAEANRPDELRRIVDVTGAEHGLMNVRAIAEASGLSYQPLLRRYNTDLRTITVGDLIKLQASIGLDPYAFLEACGARRTS